MSPPATPEAPDPLNSRECTVLNLIARGLSDQEIATDLHLSLNTIKWYTRRIYVKLGVGRRTEAVIVGRTMGLLDEVSDPEQDVEARLPLPTTNLIGRQHEEEALIQLLGDQTKRLVTVIGPGGIGKTRLAQAVIATWRQARTEPVYWVALDGLSSPDQVAPAIAAAVGFQFGDRADLHQQLVSGLRRRSMLLVLDNFEHLLDAAQLVSAMLAAAPRLIVLATSRERLNLSGETLFLLEGLAYPDISGAVQDFSSIQLFCQVARRIQPDFEPSVEDVTLIGRICQLVEGLPLAIHIAAAWIAVLTPAEIAAELEHGLHILSTRLRELPDRHHSMQAVFEHSWTLLEPADQAVFSKLAVFRGGFDRQAASSVSEASLVQLRTLVDKSLVMRVGTNRYKLHDLLRQFAAEKLHADPNRYIHTLNLHCNHYATLLRAYEEGFKTSAATIVETLNRLRLDYDNLMFGWQHAIHQPLIGETGLYSLGMCMLLAQFGLSTTCGHMFQQVLDQFEANRSQVRVVDEIQALLFYGWCFDSKSDHEEARRQFEKALLLSEKQSQALKHDPVAVGLLLTFASWNALFTHDISLARTLAERSLNIARHAGFKFGVWQNESTLGIIAFAIGDYQAARRIHQQVVRLAESYSEISAVTCGLSLLACDCAVLGETYRATEHLRRTLEMSRQFPVADALTGAITTFALLFEQQGQRETALEILAVLLHHPQCGGLSRMVLEFTLTRLRSDFPPDTYEAVLLKASNGQLSTPPLEPDFVIDTALIDHLLRCLNESSLR